MRIRFNLIPSYIFIAIILLSSCSEDEPNNPSQPPTDIGILQFDDILPQINITTLGQEILDDPKILSRITITEYDDQKNATIVYSGDIGIELRGSSSQALFDKKSYSFEIWDANKEGIDTTLLDLPSEEDWILNGPYSDKTMIRHMLAYTLSNDIERYASRTRLVELNINDNYQGLFILMEKLKRDKNRIDISKLREEENSGEDVTGGYIIKLDKATGDGNGGLDYNESNSFESKYAIDGTINGTKRTHFLYEYPDKNDITGAQKEYIADYMQQFEDALISDDFTDDDIGYGAYIKKKTFVDFLLLNELMHNPDAYRLSTYIVKDKNEQLAMGPIWDFNIAMGNTSFCGGERWDTWVFDYNSVCPNDPWLIHFWWQRLLEDPSFVQDIKDRYQELRMTSFSNMHIMSRIDELTGAIIESGADQRNFNKWDILGENIWPNNFVGNTYQEEIDFLKEWFENRLMWMDANIENL